MGKNKDKNKDEIPNPMGVTNRDILQRLNYLYQASVLLNGLASPGSTHRDDGELSMSSTTLSDKGTGTREAPPSHSTKLQRKKKRRVVTFEELSRSYVETMKSVGQKTNVKIDPSLKRRICKCCSAPLVPGVSATVRIKDSSSHGHLISYQCHVCRTERRIPAPPVLQTDLPTDKDRAEAQPTEAPTPSMSMPVAITGTGGSVHSRGQKRRKGGLQPRLLPYFARDVGHVVFRGNDRLDTARRVS